jgi:hypothetical protein
VDILKTASALSLLLLISGCISQAPVCNRPYILVGTGCCLDENNDQICDQDKPIVTSTTWATITSTSVTSTSTTTTATTTSTATTTTEARPRTVVGAVLDVQKPDGLVSEVDLLFNSAERPIVGDLQLAAYEREGLKVVVWDTTSRIEYDNSTEKVYLPPTYDAVSPLRLMNLTGYAIGDKGTLRSDDYYVYSTKPDRIILAKGLQPDLVEGNYTSEYRGYGFKLFKLTYSDE